jgi:regulator of replication initiation timing
VLELQLVYVAAAFCNVKLGGSGGADRVGQLSKSLCFKLYEKGELNKHGVLVSNEGKLAVEGKHLRDELEEKHIEEAESAIDQQAARLAMYGINLNRQEG